MDSERESNGCEMQKQQFAHAKPPRGMLKDGVRDTEKWHPEMTKSGARDVEEGHPG